MSVRLTTSLSQRLVLTPQLRQRIEMLQMTTLELSDLIQQQLNENPVLEEVATQEEAQELAEKILDHMASGGEIENFEAPTVEAAAPGLGEPSSNGSGDSETDTTFLPETETEFAANADAEGASLEAGEELAPESSRDAFEEVDFGREFQDYLDPGYKTQEFEYKEDAPTFEQFLTKAPSLSEHLEWQLHMDSADDEVCDAAECVIGNLDEDGRLKATNEEIAAQGGWSEKTVEPMPPALSKLSVQTPRASSSEPSVSRLETNALVLRGDASLSARDITSARLFYERAIEMAKAAGVDDLDGVDGAARRSAAIRMGLDIQVAGLGPNPVSTFEDKLDFACRSSGGAS